MMGLIVIGLSLLMGIGVRIVGSIDSVIYALMYTTLITPENNPFMDDHLIGMIIMVGLILAVAGSPTSLGKL